VCDRGYRGKREVNGTRIILSGKALKRDSRYQKDKKRKQCRRRAAIEPIIGHLKSDYRLARNFLKGMIGDCINLLTAACAWNLEKWLAAIFGCFFYGEGCKISQSFDENPTNESNFPKKKKYQIQFLNLNDNCKTSFSAMTN
jgi:hypothetical protein